MKKRNLTILLFAFGALFYAPGVLALTSMTYDYDANGNLTSGDGKYYEYDDANKLVRVRHGDAGGPVIAEYFYDYTGQRIKKIENGITTYYIGKHYEQRVTDTSQTHTSYYFANGERVAKKDDSGNLSYFHSDHLGGTNALTDSTGNLIEKTTYYPFGEIRQGGSEKYAYTGKEKDKLTDWYYYEARYYDSGFEHFTQADTVAPNLYDPQDLNRYAYVRNNPLTLNDPDGHSFEDSHGREWKSKESHDAYRNALIQWQKASNDAARKQQIYSNLLETTFNGLEVLSGLGDMSLSFLTGDIKGLAKGGANTSLSFLKLSGFKSPDNIFDIPGFFAHKYNFKYANAITTGGQIFNMGSGLKSIKGSSGLAHEALNNYSSFKNFNLAVPVLNYGNSLINSTGNFQSTFAPRVQYFNNR